MKLIKNDSVARARFIASGIRFYEENGIKVTPEILRLFDEQAIERASAGLKKSEACVIVYPTICGKTLA